VGRSILGFEVCPSRTGVPVGRRQPRLGTTPGMGAQTRVVIIMMVLVMALVTVTVTVMMMITTCIVAQVCDGPMYCQTKNLQGDLFFHNFVAEEPLEIPSSLLDALVPNGADRSNPRHSRENNSFDEADDNAMSIAAADPTSTSDGALLGLCGDQLNN